MRRLVAEEVRDSILFVNGSLNADEMYGPSVYPVIAQEVLHGLSVPGSGWHTSPPEKQTRRSIYIHVKRSLPYPMLAAFDMADADKSCPVRFVTTQPTQALGMLNSKFIGQQARVFADFVKKQAPDDTKEQVQIALSRAMQRKPHEAEIERALALVKVLQEEDGASADHALQYLCLVALNLNEFLYLD